MTDTSLIKKEDFSLGKSNPQTTLAIRIVGATLNEDSKTLLEIIKDNNEKDDALTFCALSGILLLVAQNKKGVNKIFDLYEYDRSGYKKLSALLELWDAILRKNSFDEYSLAVIPSENTSKQEFWATVLSGLLKRISESMFAGRIDKDEVYDRAGIVNQVFLFASNYELVDKDVFLAKHVPEVFIEVLDAMYIGSLSNSVNKIWDAGRAADEYFLRKLVLFNPLIPQSVSSIIERRWRAWFLLEDQHKREHKVVKRKELLTQLDAVLALL
ncbi:MAG TPA: hypothetical protein VGE18_01170 [Candidatus Paceibacterota bacterium]